MDETQDKPEKKDKPKARRVGYRVEVTKGKQRIKVYLGKDSDGNKKYYQETVIGGASDAERRIREIHRRHIAGEPLKVSVDTFDLAIDAWLDAVRHSVEESSLVTYKQIVKLYIKPALGSKMIAQIRKPDIQKFYNDLCDREKERGEGKIGAATIRFVHRVLGMIFKQAVEDQRIQGSPLVGVKLPKAAKSVKKQKVLTPEQIAKFLNASRDVSGGRFENLFVVAFYVGFRPTELLALKWSDLNLEARTLTVNQNLAWRGAAEWYLKEPKTPASQRTIPITDAVIQAIERERVRQDENRSMRTRTYQDHGFIFTKADGEPHAQQQVRDDCKLILIKAGLPIELSPYSARHSMATLLLTKGVDVRSVSERLGHTKPATTLNYYAHALPGRQAQVSEEMDRLLEVKSDD